MADIDREDKYNYSQKYISQMLEIFD